MLRGDRVLLRALERAEAEVLASWDFDPVMWRKVSDGPYVARTLDEVRKDFDDGKIFRSSDTNAVFAIDVDGRMVGSVSLWGIDIHNRRAHLGIAVGPDDRGKGYGTDAALVLLRYAFRDRGLHRVQLEVLADNAQAIAAYRRAGFVEEGRMREDAWVDGAFVDQLVMAVLSTDPGRHHDRS